MKKLRIGSLVVAFGVLVYLLVGCWSQMDSSYATYKTYCGGCHALPDPGQLTKAMWEKSLLPDMGARLGIRPEGYDPYDKIERSERMIMEAKELYPEKPLISESDWEAIVQYVMENAPDALPADTSRNHRSSRLTQFIPQKVTTETYRGSRVTHLRYFPEERGLTGTNANGEIWKWAPGDSVEFIHSFKSPVVSYNRYGASEYVVEMGQMHPTELDLGTFWSVEEDSREVVAERLQRPVFSAVEDLNGDGKPEFIICEFGNLTGRLTLVSEYEGRYTKTELLPYAGSIRVEIHDMNDDGLKDIVVLVAQGNEGAYILFQGSNLSFAARQILRLNPLYGSSDFDLFDYDGDGDMDIVIAHGDNADYSPIVKSYHGIRLFLNNGNNGFEEAFFYPVYGATQVEAVDFDEDGDIDFAVTSFFPDFDNNPKESFLYLENRSSADFDFEAYTFEGAEEGRWIVMESGDMDGDGDIDLVLGSFTYSPAYTPQKYMNSWNDTSTDVMYLENNLK